MVIFDREARRSTIDGHAQPGDRRDRGRRRRRGHHRPVGPAPVRLRDRPQARGLLRRPGDRDRGHATSTRSSASCASRTRSSATRPSACPTARPLAAACSGTRRSRLPPADRRSRRTWQRQHRHRRRQRHPRPRAAVHRQRPGRRHLRPGRQPPLAEPPDHEWEEQVSFFDVTCWAQLAENVAESVPKGSRVVVTGRLEQRSWETQEGDKRSKVEIVADEVGPSLRWATAADHQERASRRRRRRRLRRRWRWWRQQPSRAQQPTGAGGGAGYDPDEEPF